MNKIARNVPCPSRLRTMGRMRRYLRRNVPAFMFNQSGIEEEAAAQVKYGRADVLIARRYEQGASKFRPLWMPADGI